MELSYALPNRSQVKGPVRHAIRRDFILPVI